jgi:hypothetical protein
LVHSKAPSHRAPPKPEIGWSEKSRVNNRSTTDHYWKSMENVV